MSSQLNASVSALRSAIEQGESFVIIPHVNPDGDAIGSAIALYIALTKKGKRVELIGADEVPKNLRFLPRWEAFRSAREMFPDDASTENMPKEIEHFDLAIIVDLSAPRRLAHARHLIPLAKTVAVVDHHELGDDVADGILVVDSSYAATALLLYYNWEAIGLEFDSDIAQCLLTGIATDTGGFKFQNTDARALRAAADLVQRGGNLSQIHEMVWDRKPESALKLLGIALNNLRITANGQVAYSTISLQEYESVGATDEDSEGIVNEVGKVESCVISALFREHLPNRIRVSVRSRGDIDVAEVCRKFEGGGHKNAAGCTFSSSLESAVAALMPSLEAAAR